MNRSIASARGIMAICALVVAAACGPTPSTPPSPTPTPTATPRFLSVNCNQTTLGVAGQQAVCSAAVTLSDNTVQDQTSAAQWSSSNTSVATVSAGGLVSAVGNGTTDIRATAQNLSGTRSMSVALAPSVEPVARVSPERSVWLQDSPLQFDVTASSASGKFDSRSYRFSYGDGVVDTTPYLPVATEKVLFQHAYRTTGSFQAQLTLTDGLGRQSTATVPILITSLTGRWANVQMNPTTGRTESRHLELAHASGGGLSGTYQHPDGSTEPLTGSAAGGTIDLTLNSRTIAFYGKAGFDVSSFYAEITGGSANGQTLRFTRQ